MGNIKKIKCSTSRSSLNSFLRSESAASGAIAFILLFGILFSIYSVIHLGYVPEWKSETEDAHMTNIWKDMNEIKSKIDRNTILLMSIPTQDTKSSLPNVKTTLSFHTGSPKIPLINSAKFSGTVSVNTDQCNMTLFPANDNEVPISCGTISYRSNNMYYVDQTFRYESGALILAQKEKAVMKSFPTIRVFEESPGNYTFLINAVEILGPRETLSSSSNCAICLRNYSFKSVYDEDANNFTLKIKTDYPDAWEAYFREMMEGAGLKKEDYILYTDKVENPDEIEKLLIFSFPAASSTNSLKRLYVSKTTVTAELGVGLS